MRWRGRLQRLASHGGTLLPSRRPGPTKVSKGGPWCVDRTPGTRNQGARAPLVAGAQVHPTARGCSRLGAGAFTLPFKSSTMGSIQDTPPPRLRLDQVISGHRCRPWLHPTTCWHAGSRCWVTPKSAHVAPNGCSCSLPLRATDTPSAPAVSPPLRPHPASSRSEVPNSVLGHTRNRGTLGVEFERKPCRQLRAPSCPMLAVVTYQRTKRSPALAQSLADAPRRAYRMSRLTGPDTVKVGLLALSRSTQLVRRSCT